VNFGFMKKKVLLIYLANYLFTISWL
jgi:hypothetical protein